MHKVISITLIFFGPGEKKTNQNKSSQKSILDITEETKWFLALARLRGEGEGRSK